MIVKRKWARNRHGLTWPVEGWFLFGLVPLYVRDLDYRPTVVGRPADLIPITRRPRRPKAASMEEPDYRNILLQLIASLTLCDHLGDVAEDVAQALTMAEVAVEWDDMSDLKAKLHEMGVTTLYGTSLE